DGVPKAVPGYEFEVETVGRGKKSRVKACVTLTMDRAAAEQLHREVGRLLDEKERATIRVGGVWAARRRGARRRLGQKRESPANGLALLEIGSNLASGTLNCAARCPRTEVFAPPHHVSPG